MSLALCVAGCGGQDARCAEIVDDAVDVFQTLISTVDELDIGEMAAAGEDFAVPGMEDMERRADELQDEAEAAGCSEDKLRSLLSEKTGELRARTVFGQAVLESIRQQGLFPEQ